MNIGRLIDNGDSDDSGIFPSGSDWGIDPDWFKPDNSFAGDVEQWLAEMSYHDAGKRAQAVAREIVKDSRTTAPS
jgi:hypothetical protein